MMPHYYGYHEDMAQLQRRVGTAKQGHNLSIMTGLVL